MKYKLIVDKQSRTNPSTDKKEYEIDVEELRFKGDVADSLIITVEETYIMRRLSLSEFNVLSVLETPIKEPLGDLNVELFEGDNYIYLTDMTGNKFYAEYIIKNEFNELYVTNAQMNTAINQSAKSIELGVSQKLIGYTTIEETEQAKQGAIDAANTSTDEKLGNYSTTLQMNAAINLKANEIANTVSETYSTKTETTAAKQEAISSANASTDEKLENYSTTTQMNSAITQKASEITSEVNKKVGNDELGTKITQNYESVQIAWNKISEFIQFLNAQLQIKDNSKKLLMALDKLGMHFYKNTGNELGDVGIQDSNVISFAVMNEQGSMAWGIKYTHNGETDFYPVFSFNGKMVADSSSSGGYGFDGYFDFQAPVRLFEKPIYFTDENSGYIEGDTLGGVIIVVPGMQSGLGFGVDDGSGNTLLYINKDIFQIISNSISFSTILGKELLEVAQNVEGGYSFDFKNNSIVNVDNVPNTDNIEYISGSTGAGGYVSFTIKNEGNVTLYKSSSDKKLKKNIKVAKTKALDKINQIKHKEFDWKANNKHQEIGYIAQEMQEIDSTFVHYAKFKTKSGEEKEDWQINTLSVLATATKAIQEQQEEIEKQEKIIKELTQRVERLEENNG